MIIVGPFQLKYSIPVLFVGEMHQAGFSLLKVQPLSLLVHLPSLSWSSLMFISVFLGDGGGVERNSPCGIHSCVGKVYLFTRSEV